MAPLYYGVPMPAAPVCPPGMVAVGVQQAYCTPKAYVKPKKVKLKPVAVPVAASCLPPVPLPAAVPAPYAIIPPSVYTVAGSRKTCKCPCCAAANDGGDGDDDDGYKKISYQGPYIPLHILKKGTKVEDITVGGGHHFSVPKVDFVQRSYQDNMSFKHFVVAFAGKGDWIVTQVRELGEGRWEKAISIDTGSDKGKKSMADVGWTSDRGPVWLVIERKKKGDE